MDRPPTISVYAIAELGMAETQPTTRCRLHCTGGERMGNHLDVVISMMVFANVTGCLATVSFHLFGTARFNNRQIWNEYTPVQGLKLANDNPYVRQLALPPNDLPTVCPSRSPLIEACVNNSWSRSSPKSLVVWNLFNVQLISCTAFMPPGISHENYFKTYSAMAQLLRLNGSHNNMGYYATSPLPSHTLALHLRTGQTMHDVQQGFASLEARFQISFEKLKQAALSLTRQYDIEHLFVAYDDTNENKSDSQSTKYKVLQAFPNAITVQSPYSVRNMAVFMDHRLLSTAKVVLAYSFSSFSWTAAQMGGAPYYVVDCADNVLLKAVNVSTRACASDRSADCLHGSKCEQYSCHRCVESSAGAGVRVIDF